MTLGSQCGSSGVQARPATQLSIGGASQKPAVNPFSLVDLQARQVRYLRISVTDRCNFRCTYCMPAAGVPVVPRNDLLSFDEIEQLARIFVQLGISKIRLTGGEPLVRRDIVQLVERIARIEGVLDLAMTTNGQQLAELAKPLRDAGLHRLNVSIDTLDPLRFAQVTRQGQLKDVLRGLDAADRAGFSHTKINAVMLRGLNDNEIVDLADFAAQRRYILRYIEYMPIGVDQHWGPETFLPAADIRGLLSQQYEIEPDPLHKLPGGGPAVYWRGKRRDGRGETLQFGVISAVSEKFCELCNRVRLSPTGTLRECLSTAGALSLRDMLRAGATQAELSSSIALALAGKVDGHRFDQALQTMESMSAIGG